MLTSLPTTTSETSATKPAQKLFTFNMRQQGFRSVWSQPVRDKFPRSDGQPSMRGHASGVAAFSRQPIRCLHGTLDEADITSSRLLHCLLTLDAIEIQLIVVYGMAASGTTEANRRLLQNAIHAAANFPIPYIILGDFNSDPWKLGMNEILQ